MFGSVVGFSGTADLMAVFLPTACTASLLALLFMRAALQEYGRE